MNLPRSVIRIAARKAGAAVLTGVVATGAVFAIAAGSLALGGIAGAIAGDALRRRLEKGDTNDPALTPEHYYDHRFRPDKR